MPNTSCSHRLALVAGCAVVALALPLAPGAIDPAQAFSCGLSANDDATINTVGGANSGSGNARIACGPNATATGGNATAVGNAPVASGFDSAAFGSFARAEGDRSTAVGSSAASLSGTAQGYTAVGARAGATHTLGAFSTSIGGANTNAFSPGATGDFSIAIGGGDSASGNPGAVAGGANGNNFTIAIGTRAQAGVGASGRTGAVAVGHNARANAIGAVATGQNSRAPGNNSAAYGRLSRADGNNSVAIGFRAEASHNNAVAIGRDSVTSAANTVSVGAPGNLRRIMRVADAVANTDAVNLRQVQQMIAAASAGGNATVQGVAFTTDASAPGRQRPHTVAVVPGGSSTAQPGTPGNSGQASADELPPSPISGWASVNLDGTVSGARNVAQHVRHSVGRYEIVFKRRSTLRCAFNTTLGDIGFIAVKPGARANSVRVETRDPQGRLADTAFYLMAVC